MLFPLLAMRVASRSLMTSSTFSMQRTLPFLITRSFSVSRITWAPEAAAEKKPAAKKAASKEKPISKSSGKTAAKKPKKKVVKKEKKVAKKVKKAVPVKIVIKPEDRPPKLPAAPYLLFFRKYFEGVKRVEGEAAQHLIIRTTKEASASWNALTEQEKQPFRDEYAVAYIEYKKQLEEYKKNTDPAIIKEINKRRVSKGQRRIRTLPTQGISGYLLYTMESRKAVPTPPTLVANQELVKELGRTWKALPEEEKLRYTEKAKAYNEAKEK